MTDKLLIMNAAQVITMKGHSDRPAIQGEMAELDIIENGAVYIEDGKIAAVGPTDEISSNYSSNQRIDASGKVVTPGLIDPHTHLVHAGTRENEYAMRLNGKTYMEIMESGGGIHATTRATQKASREMLYEQSKKRLDQFLLHGVTTVEAKSGYGLTLEHEIKQLEVAHQLHRNHPVDLISTFMGAHAIPMAEKDDPEPFVERVIHEMIPEVAKRKLATFNDVFCERGVFTPEQSRRILEAGKQHGLMPKIHADEIEPYEGAELAASVGAVSADHLLKASDKGIKALAESGVVGVLLPGTAFFLMAEFAEARKMIEAGIPIALSTDANPGSSPTISLPFMMNLGCLKMGMTPEEVLTATTINAAHAIGCGREAGSLERGKKADVTIFNVPNYLTLSYQYGMNHVDTVIKSGKPVVIGGRLQ
ncbi:imidazolonepropionase [Halobacillus sp. A1]|uniref:imidazolonepropionase n=1 Tax=Halobacillus sp. A1 TaxID=2880262 RepID=UPI0020A67D6E|nr:imidazolonepropionase [Halobacillus sp. A1]MCP3029932.1 imidazolonepropionase [Halobacillus sp. A1]